MAACKENEDRKAVVSILRMLLSTCGEAPEGKDEEEDDGLRLSRLIDQTGREYFDRQLECTTNVENSHMTSCLLAVLRECLLMHRWVAALRVLTSVVRRLPNHYGRTVLHCVLELCAQLSLPMPDSLMLRLKTYAELSEFQVAVECFMSRAAAGQPIAVCRAALAPMPRRRAGLPGRDDTHDRLLTSAYAGLASYAQYLDASQTLEKTSEKELSDEITTRMKSYARDALEKWDRLVNVPGVWDVFVVKQVELLELAGDLDSAEDVLLKYARRRRPPDGVAPSTAAVWPNALHLLYSFYERHAHPSDGRRQRVEVLEELCALVPSHCLTLTLYREWRDDAALQGVRDRVGLLFNLLDYAAWRSDVRPWRLLARELAHCAAAILDPDAFPPSSTVVDAVRRAWSVRKDWWPAYHFAADSLPQSSSTPSEESVSLIGYKAAVAYFLLPADNSYTQIALTLVDQYVVKTKGSSQLKKVVRKCLTLPIDS